MRHYAYVDRPYDACWTKLAQAPHAVLGAPNAAAQGTAASALTAKRGGVEVSRTVTIRFGGIVCEEEMARMALRWQDSRHATWSALVGVLTAIALLAVRLAQRRSERARRSLAPGREPQRRDAAGTPVTETPAPHAVAAGIDPLLAAPMGVRRGAT